MQPPDLLCCTLKLHGEELHWSGSMAWGKASLEQATGMPCRYIAHFRSIHRGAFFAQMRTTAVRKLLPDSWGFLCPVHTPDGAPCGLLNHLAAACLVVTHPPRDADNMRTAIMQVGGCIGVHVFDLPVLVALRAMQDHHNNHHLFCGCPLPQRPW